MPNFFLSHKRTKVAGRLQPAQRFTAAAPRSGPRTAEFRNQIINRTHKQKLLWNQWSDRSEAMKLLTILSAGLVLAAASAQAQSPDPRYTPTSDINGPYAAMPPGEGPGYGPDGYGPNGYGPRLLPAREVYTVLRDNGFSPLGTPRQRGFFYMISVTNRRGDDGRLVIDARNGRIVRFVPAYHFGLSYGPSWPMPPMGAVPRPPAPVPKLASRSPSPVPLPKAEPPAQTSEVKPQVMPEVKSLAEKPAAEQGQQSAANQIKPAASAPTPASPPPASVEAKPSTPQQPEILPTQEMPKVQGFE
jgi:hypothetical protein